MSFTPCLFSWGDPISNQDTSNFYTTYNRTAVQERVQDLSRPARSARRTTRAGAWCSAAAGARGLWALLLHNVSPKFTTGFITKVYKGMHVSERYRQESVALSDEQIASWIAQ